jgi:hypothetical protein
MDIRKLSANQFFVQSDSGELYKVTLSGENKSSITCTCKGFSFRRTCKHVDAVKELLAQTGRKVRTKSAPKADFPYVHIYEPAIRKVLELKKYTPPKIETKKQRGKK